MSSIKEIVHATEPTKGWELRLGYSKGNGYYRVFSPYTKTDPSSLSYATSLFGSENSRKDLLECVRKSSKREAEAIALFDKEVAEFIAAHPAKEVEEFVVNVGDRFFMKEAHWTRHWNPDTVITIVYLEGNRYFGITDRMMAKGQWEPTPYSYAELVDLERLEPASEEALDEIDRNRIEQANAKREAQQQRQDLIKKGRSLVPSWAKAAIVAKLKENQSDSQTDYFGGKTVDTRVLGFSKTDRNDFAEMRKFAALFDGTAHLTEKEHENRENWSGGGGYYLGTHRYHGWQVEKNSYGLQSDELLYALGKYGLPDGQDDEVSPQPEANGAINGVVIRRNEELNGIEVKFPDKDAAKPFIDKLKSLGFQFSRTNKLWYARNYSEARERQVKSALGVA